MMQPTRLFWKYAGLGFMWFLILLGLGACSIGAGVYENLTGKAPIQFELRK